MRTKMARSVEPVGTIDDIRDSIQRIIDREQERCDDATRSQRERLWSGAMVRWLARARDGRSPWVCSNCCKDPCEQHPECGDGRD